MGKYEEALERARKGMPIDEVFPELQESEDERIRKEIINFLRSPFVTENIVDEKISPWIAYLEKQKENIEKEYVFRPLAGTDIAIAAEQAIRRAKEGEHLVLAFNGIYMPVSKYDSAKGLVNKYNTYLKEQNPVERSLEDDHIIGFVYDLLNEIEWNDNWAMSKEECLRLLNNYSPQKPAENISQLTVQGKGVYKICPRCKERMVRDDSKVYTSMPPQYGYKCPKCGEMKFDTVMYDSPEMEEQKPAERSDSVAKEMFIKALERAVEQTKKGYELTDCDKHSWWEDFKAYSGIKPAEWSEEDETFVKDAIKAVENYYSKGCGQEELVTWLKFLPERFVLQPKQEWTEAAEEYAGVTDAFYHQIEIDAFKAGAEWMAGQGETFETEISNIGMLSLPELNIQAGDKVTVQIRKK